MSGGSRWEAAVSIRALAFHLPPPFLSVSKTPEPVPALSLAIFDAIFLIAAPIGQYKGSFFPKKLLCDLVKTGNKDDDIVEIVSTQLARGVVRIS